ncbi:NDP-hexose 2,3-dehydratase family protein [Adlercreutzia aquisgranensis]|uniref:NDP-hexose 2,3-dehydratase family protein n=1 Tax=Adlercreutzia aquisgranensis TaxID=2941323 RepID=UPI00203E3C34|nr:NDP-hexose 2,3-dehydratase family protein [Adlercreutzia aquisgranensis]
MAPDKQTVDAFWRSWASDEGLEPFESLLGWVRERNEATEVSVSRVGLDECSPWRLDPATGRIGNPAGSFFQVAGLEVAEGQRELAQPVLLQGEIGYLGIVAKVFDGVAHLLMQAKVEPGNVNRVQVSPTVQATRSNFLRLHGGRRPAYLEYFLRNGSAECRPVSTLVDQVQSEQSSRFLGKRNRNVVVLAEGEVEALPTHRWMTLGQVKRLMRYPNLVNMDTRTVLSCIPWSLWGPPSAGALEGGGADRLALNSILGEYDFDETVEIFQAMNDARMFDFSQRRIVGLCDLEDWSFSADGTRFTCRDPYPFSVGFFDIAIEGREVARWRQPLFEAQGMATFALVCREDADCLRFLVRLKREPGCFDTAELAPTLQREAGSIELPDAVDSAVLGLLERGEGVVRDVVLSEEGGRFYCEENRNVLLRLSADRAEALFPSGELPRDCFWVDCAILNRLVQFNNVLNIQLRNLLSLIDPWERPEDGGML